MQLGDQFVFERGGVVYTDYIRSVHYSSGSPAIYRTLNRWQHMIRRMTPRRWRKSLLISPGKPAMVTINDDSQRSGMTIRQLEQMKGGFTRSAY